MACPPLESGKDGAPAILRRAIQGDRRKGLLQAVSPSRKDAEQPHQILLLPCGALCATNRKAHTAVMTMPSLRPRHICGTSTGARMDTTRYGANIPQFKVAIRCQILSLCIMRPSLTQMTHENVKFIAHLIAQLRKAAKNTAFTVHIRSSSTTCKEIMNDTKPSCRIRRP